MLYVRGQGRALAFTLISLVSIAAGPSCAVVFSNPAKLNGGGNGTGNISLEVPIQMIDGQGLGSNGAGVRDVSWTPLNTTDYDGTVTYQFEVVAENVSVAAKNIYLKDKTGATLYATVPMPATTTIGRFRIPFTPTPGAQVYGVEIDPTASNYDVNVWEARLIVQQKNASRTKIYIPLSSGDDNNASGLYHSNSPTNDSFDSTVSAAYVVPPGSGGEIPISIWTKTAGAYVGGLASGTPWTFQAMLYGNGAGAIGDAALYDITAGGAVANVTNSASNLRELLSTSVSNVTLTDGHQYEVRYRKNGGGVNVHIHKAGLWVTLTSMTRGEVYYRVSRIFGGANASATTYYSRSYLDVSTVGSTFTSPRVYLEATSHFTTGAGASTYFLLDDGATFSGTGASALTTAGSSSVFSAARGVNRSPDLYATSAISTAASSNYVFGFTRAGADLLWIHGASIVVGFGN